MFWKVYTSQLLKLLRWIVFLFFRGNALSVFHRLYSISIFQPNVSDREMCKQYSGVCLSHLYLYKGVRQSLTSCLTHSVVYRYVYIYVCVIKPVKWSKGEMGCWLSVWLDFWIGWSVVRKPGYYTAQLILRRALTSACERKTTVCVSVYHVTNFKSQATS